MCPSESRIIHGPHPLHRQSIALLAALMVLPFAAVACNDSHDGGEPDAGESKPPVNTAFYLPMRDGVRIAVDLWLPGNASAGNRVPIVVRATRYSRNNEVLDRSAVPQTDSEAEAQAFLRNGYAQMVIDARGSSASFGTRPQPWSAAEGEDYGEIIDWIVKQPWSNGRIASYGTSYDSNTAEMIGTRGKAAVKAVIPRFGYPDVYSDIVFPGGVFNEGFVKTWLTRNLSIDANDVCGFAGVSGPECDGLNAMMSMAKPVDADVDRSQRAAAILQHRATPDQYASVSAVVSADDKWNGDNFATISPGARGAQAEATQTAFMAWASWMDLGTARGALNRWKTTNVPMTVYLGPWNHDAALDADPFAARDLPAVPSPEEQFSLTVAFLNQHLGSATVPAPVRKIVYYSIGEDVRKEADTWPPTGTVTKSVFLRANNFLSTVAPGVNETPDTYAVDFTTSTGGENGWWTKLTAHDIFQADRKTEDAKLLVYTSPALEADTEITGHPQVTLYLSSTETDGAVFAYLEDVAPDGTVTYITEGQLRLLHRKLQVCGPRDGYGPCHSFLSQDAQPMPPGILQEVTFGLQPTSVLLRAGHSIRLAIAGQDASTFTRLPAQGNPVLSVAHDSAHPSRLELPLAPRGGAPVLR